MSDGVLLRPNWESLQHSPDLAGFKGPIYGRRERNGDAREEIQNRAQGKEGNRKEGWRGNSTSVVGGIDASDDR